MTIKIIDFTAYAGLLFWHHRVPSISTEVVEMVEEQQRFSHVVDWCFSRAISLNAPYNGCFP